MKLDNIKTLFFKFLPLISYFFVGLLATLVEWIFFYLFDNVIGFHYQAATVLAIVISTFANWFFGRLITFRNAEKGNVILEIAKIYLVSIVGLLINMLLMWIFVEKAGVKEMYSKMITTCIVFAYNFLIRKLVVYRKTKISEDK